MLRLLLLGAVILSKTFAADKVNFVILFADDVSITCTLMCCITL